MSIQAGATPAVLGARSVPRSGISLRGEGSFDPRSVSGLIAWGKADSLVPVADNTEVLAWSDSSASGSDYVSYGGIAPRYFANRFGTLPGLDVGGGKWGEFLSGPLTTTAGAKTIFFVYRLGAVPLGAGAQYAFMTPKSAGPVWSSLRISRTGANADAFNCLHDSANATSIQALVAGGGSGHNLNPHIVCNRYNGGLNTSAASYTILYGDEGSLALAATGPNHTYVTAPADRAGMPAQVSSGGGSSFGFSGAATYGEYLVFNRELALAECNNIAHYLKRWGAAWVDV